MPHDHGFNVHAVLQSQQHFRRGTVLAGHLFDKRGSKHDKMQLNGGNEERGNLAGQHQVQVFDRGTGRAHEVFPHQVGVQLWFFGTSGFEEGDETNRVEDGHGGQFALALGHGGGGAIKKILW